MFVKIRFERQIARDKMLIDANIVDTINMPRLCDRQLVAIRLLIFADETA